MVRIGYDSNNDLLATADINLPDVSKASGPIVVGSVGVRVVNVNASRIVLNQIDYFEIARWFGGIGQGTVYNDIWLGQSNSGEKLLYIVPGTGGWCNDNNIYGGNFYSGGTRVSGRIQIYIDGSGSGNAVVGNNFIKTSLEGDPEYLVYAKYAFHNHFFGIYHESGLAFSAVTVSGDTLTRTAHGLSVGDMVSFKATAMPSGTFEGTPYYVVTVPTADTFKISRKKGGTAITTGSAGTSVTVSRQARMYWDGSSGNTQGNIFHGLFTPTSVHVDMVQVGQARNNYADTDLYQTRRPYLLEGSPIFRASNAGFSTRRPLWGAYLPGTDPNTDPDGWTCALSDQGVLFQNSSGADTGILYAAFGGGLTYKETVSATARGIATCVRSGLVATPAATSVPANGRLVQTYTVTGAKSGWFVTVVPNSDMPDGLAIAWARCSADDTVTMCLHNWTGSSIDVSSRTFKFMCSHDTL